MSQIYKKPSKGRLSIVEKKAVSDIEKVLEKFPEERRETITLLEDLTSFSSELKSKYPDLFKEVKEVPGSSPKEIPETSSEQNPIKKDVEVDTNDDMVPEFDLTPSDNSSIETDNTDFGQTDSFDLGDFEETTTTNPLSAPFKSEAMFKLDPLNTEAENIASQESSSNSLGSDGTDAVKSAWEIAKEQQDDPQPSSQEKLDAANRLKSNVEPESTEESENKTKLAKSTSKKATKSLAKNAAKVFEFLTEWGTHKYGKISDSYLDKLESKGLLDRHYVLDPEQGKTIAQLIDQHNESISKIKTDPDASDDLVEAMLLVAEKHEIEVTPETNLAMVVISMIVSLARESHEQKMLMKRTLRKATDNYTLGVRQVQTMEQEIERLKAENLQYKKFNTESKNVQENGIPLRYQLDDSKKNQEEIPKIRKLNFGKAEQSDEKPQSSGLNHDDIVVKNP